jgi:hypothetical protein
MEFRLVPTDVSTGSAHCFIKLEKLIVGQRVEEFTIFYRNQKSACSQQPTSRIYVIQEH